MTIVTATVVTAGIGAVVLEVMVLATEARAVAVVAMVLRVVMVAMVVVVVEVVVVEVVVVVVVVVEVVVVNVVVVVVVMVVVGMEQMAVGIGLPACLHEVRQPVLKVPCRLHQCVASTQVHVGPLHRLLFQTRLLPLSNVDAAVLRSQPNSKHRISHNRRNRYLHGIQQCQPHRNRRQQAMGKKGIKRGGMQLSFLFCKRQNPS